MLNFMPFYPGADFKERISGLILRDILEILYRLLEVVVLKSQGSKVGVGLLPLHHRKLSYFYVPVQQSMIHGFR